MLTIESRGLLILNIRTYSEGGPSESDDKKSQKRREENIEKKARANNNELGYYFSTENIQEG